MVHRIEGLLRRQRSIVDERRLVITVTDSGRALQERARHVPGTMVCSVGISADDAAVLQELCERIQVTLNDDTVAPGV